MTQLEQSPGTERGQSIDACPACGTSTANVQGISDCPTCSWTPW